VKVAQYPAAAGLGNDAKKETRVPAETIERWAFGLAGRAERSPDSRRYRRLILGSRFVRTRRARFGLLRILNRVRPNDPPGLSFQFNRYLVKIREHSV